MWPFLFCIRIENFEGACTGQNFLEISNGRKTVRMAPILPIFGPNESQRCQLNFEKFREGKKFEKASRKVRKFLTRTRFLGRNKIEMVMYFGHCNSLFHLGLPSPRPPCSRIFSAVGPKWPLLRREKSFCKIFREVFRSFCEVF